MSVQAKIDQHGHSRLTTYIRVKRLIIGFELIVGPGQSRAIDPFSIFAAWLMPGKERIHAHETGKSRRLCPSTDQTIDLVCSAPEEVLFGCAPSD